MELIVINKRNGTVINTYNRVDAAEQVKEFLGQDVVNITMRSFEPINFDIGDWLEVFGEKYTINILPQERKVNDRLFEYVLRFEGIQYDLIKVQLLDIDISGFSTGSNFSLMGNLQDFGELVVRNLNRVYGLGTWIIGDVEQNTEYKLTSFTNNNCLEALQSLCDQFSTHFYIDKIASGFRLSIKKVEDILDDIFKYGRHKGLYNLERTNVDSKNIVTKLFAYGGTTNIPSDYRQGSIRLKMPIGVIHSEGQPFITDTNAVSEYGATEGSINFDNIYPTRIGIVSQINTTERLIFFDNSMPFNLNNQLLTGLSAKVNFKSGALAGYTFECVNYNHITKQFKINPYTDERGFVFPSVDDESFRIAVGDTYVLTDIKMPQSYITAAENELYEKALEELAIQSVPAVQWTLTVDSNYIKSKEITPGQIINYFKVGYYINVIDTDLRINGKSQIIGFTRNVLKPYEYVITVSEQFVNKRNVQRKSLRFDISKIITTEVTRVVMAVNNTQNNVNSSTQSTTIQSLNWGQREW